MSLLTTEEHRQKISLSLTGTPKSYVHRLNLGRSKRQRWLQKFPIGTKVAYLTIIGYAWKHYELPSGKQLSDSDDGVLRWCLECQCSCNNTIFVLPCFLASDRVKSCGCMAQKDRVSAAIKITTLPSLDAGITRVYSSMRSRCRRDNLQLSITKNEVKTLSQQNCCYCGAPPRNVARKNKGKIKYFRDTIFAYNGIDRVDSSKGYEPNNVVPCCKVCNTAKNTLSVIEFLEWAKRLATFQE